MTIRVRLYLRERVLNLSAGAALVAGLSVLVTDLSVLVAVPFLAAMRTAVLMDLPLSASARVDVSKVERVGLGEVAQVELYHHTVRGVLEGGGAAHPESPSGCRSSLTLALW